MSRSTLISALSLAASGLLLTVVGSGALTKSSQLAAGDNPFGIYRSAYGKLLARLGETTIDRIWHLGVEQIVPHYMSGESHSTAAVPKGTETIVAQKLPAKPVIELAKSWIQKRVVSQHSRTNPYSLSDQHKHRVHKDIEKLMSRSYRLDPTHYGAYNSYNLFITHHTFGGTDESRDHAKVLGEETIRYIEDENEDAEVFLTAASASMNLFIIETEDARVNQTPISLETLQKYRDQISGFLTTFEKLQEKAQDSGVWDNVSTDRQVEIAQRYRFSKKTFGQFDAMIARAENPDQVEATAEVAETQD